VNGIERQRLERLQDWIHTTAHYVHRGLPHEWLSSGPLAIEQAPEGRVRFSIEMDAPEFYSLMMELQPQRDERRRGV
jgi:hypothetical protein